MNTRDSKTRCRLMLLVTRIAIITLIALCSIDQARAQNQWTTNGNNINNTNSGNVGIGTATPLDNLHLFNSSSVFQVILQGGLNNSGFIGYWNPGGLFLSNNRNIRTGSNFNTGSLGAQIVLGNSGEFNNGDISFQTISSGTVGSVTDLMRIKSNGNIGIGTTSPATRLHVVGDVTVNGEVRSSSGGFRFPDGTVQMTATVSGGGTISGVTAGSGLSGGGTSGAVTLTNSDRGSSQSIFKNIANAAGSTQFAAGSNSDTIRFAGTGGTTVTFDAATKKVTIDSSISTGGTISGVTAGSGLSGGGTSGAVTLTNSDRGSSQSIFKNIANAAGSTQFAAGSNNDTIRFAGTGGTTVTFDAATKKVIIDSTSSTGSAANISAGQFGQNTGGGNYIFPGNVTVNGNIAAKYQDMAEWVPASHAMAAGTVVVLDPTKSNHVTSSTQSYDSRVAGVISFQPGLILGEEAEGRVLVATTGRVKVKVDASNGPIQIGDLLVTSDKEGVAMKSLPVEIGGVRIHRPGTLIGKALEPLAKGTGEILVLLSLQ